MSRKFNIIWFTCISIYLIVKPFYIFPSGQPQPGDYIIIFIFLATIFSKKVKSDLNTKRVLRYSWSFAIYASLVNISWYFFIDAPEMLRYASYYIFNVAALHSITNIGNSNPKRFYLFITAGILLSLLFQIGSVFFLENTAVRNAGSFNNPNQLGYFALLMAISLLVVANAIKIQLWLQIFGLACASYLTIVSSSRGAMISLMFLFIVHFIKKPGHGFVIVCLAIIAILLLDDHSIFETAIYRLEQIGKTSDDSISTRGYGRIFSYPEQLIIGAGEGGLFRFAGAYLEIHSTIGTVLFSYGLIGTILFFTLFYYVYKICGFKLFMYLIAAFLYGLTHQGLRFTFLWTMIGIIIVVGMNLNDKKRLKKKTKIVKDTNYV